MLKDRFLTGILIGIGVLVVAALIFFFARRGQVTYGDDSTPAGALENYCLAIQNHDYERAYRYLADRTGKLSLDQFSRGFLTYQGDAVTGSAVEVGQVVLDQRNQTASVQMTILNSSRDLFGMSVRTHDVASLILQNGAWKVVSVPYPYGSPEPPVEAPPKLEPSPTPGLTPTGAAP